MPKRKRLPNVPDLVDFGRNSSENLMIQKTNPLLSLSETDMTLPEFKILDAYLSRINSHNPDERYVTLEKGKIEEYLGLKKINQADLEKRVKNLFQPIVIRDERKPKKFTIIPLFGKAECEQDENGVWQVHLAASVEAMEYIFTPENLGYLKYRLGNVINLTSRYSYVLYLYLEHNRFRGSWEVSLDEIKGILRCTSETYNQYFRFNGLVLKRCKEELDKKTDCHFEYEAVKRGRTVTAIRFIMETKPEIILPEDGGQLTMEGYIDERDPYWVFGPLPWLTDAQGEEVKLLTLQVPRYKMPDSGTDTNSYYDYLNMVGKRFNRAKEEAKNKGKPIKNEYAYLLKIIKGDIGE